MRVALAIVALLSSCSRSPGTAEPSAPDDDNPAPFRVTVKPGTTDSQIQGIRELGVAGDRHNAVSPTVLIFRIRGSQLAQVGALPFVESVVQLTWRDKFDPERFAGVGFPRRVQVDFYEDVTTERKELVRKALVKKGARLEHWSLDSLRAVIDQEAWKPLLGSPEVAWVEPVPQRSE